MSKLIYSLITSLDGYMAPANESGIWAMPDEEVLAFLNELDKPIGTYLYGRKMYDTMVEWDTMNLENEQDYIRDQVLRWKTADKIVYSKTLKKVSSSKTSIKTHFDPEDIELLKQTATGDLAIGGPHIALEAIKAGLVDEYHQFIAPAIIGSGYRWLPDNVRIDLKLVDQKRFPNGFIYLRYQVIPEKI
jgi:dihydrofolate reductase